jgi:hypothetical protein
MAGISLSCAAPASQGTYGDVYLIKKADFDVATVTKTGQVITAIVLPVGAQAYKVGLADSMSAVRFNVTESESGMKLFSHEVDLKIDNIGATGKGIYWALSTGRYVAICRIKGGLAADSFQVLGTYVGMQNEEGGFDSAANGGTVMVTLKTASSPVQEYEAAPPANFWASSLAGTEDALEALLEVVS